MTPRSPSRPSISDFGDLYRSVGRIEGQLELLIGQVTDNRRAMGKAHEKIHKRLDKLERRPMLTRGDWWQITVGAIAVILALTGRLDWQAVLSIISKGAG